METTLRYSKYALVNRQIELTKSGIISSDDANNVNNNSNAQNDKLLVFPGSLIQIIGTPDGNESDKCIVQIFHLDALTSLQFYEIKLNYLVRVAEDIWPYIISISNLENRLRLACNKEKCLWLINLKQNDILCVQGELFKKPNTTFDCIIRYIGPVQELNSIGYFFGLEILHPNNGYSPQAKDIPFATKYLQCEPALSIFATADWIAPISSELKQKLPTKKLLNDTIDRIYTALVHDQRSDNKYKKRLPSAQFYDSSIDTDKYDSDMMTESDKHDDCLPIVEESKYSSKEPKVYKSNIPSERKAKNSSSLRKNDINKTTDSSMKEREIVITQSDIEEATKNEHNIIIVKNPPEKENVDLADLLGSNWPTNAGGPGMILNRAQLVPKSYKPDNKLEAGVTYEGAAKHKDKVVQATVEAKSKPGKHRNSYFLVNRQK